MVSERGSATRRGEKASHNDGYALGLMMVEHRTEDALGLIVLELDVQTVLNADLHLDGVVAIRWHTIRMYPEVLLLRHVRYPS